MDERHDPAPDELAHTIRQLQALANAVHERLLAAIAAYDRTGAWEQDGAASMANWLTAELGTTYFTAKEYVRVAASLAQLPAIGGAFAAGRLSWDQTRHVASMATPDNDAALAADAPGHSAAHLARMAARVRTLTGEDLDDELRRGLTLRWENGHRVLHLSGRLPAADGAVVERALERAALHAPQREAGGEPAAARLADALVELAGTRLGSDPDSERSTIVVHADASALTAGGGIAELQDGPRLTIEAALRLACDARWQIEADDESGEPIGIGRTSRTVPPWLVRAIRLRDRTCRFPGCLHRRWLHIHHIRHWAHGGGTDLTNLVHLCGHHHRLVHEHGWDVERRGDGTIVFLRPDGTAYDPRPQPLDPAIRDRMLGPRRGPQPHEHAGPPDRGCSPGRPGDDGSVRPASTRERDPG